ncbi:putative membrane protein [Spirosoma endophyticum]|uniref:Putative membrane protein n=2 Tax=Spirosoma endophyticum TaxID=662367 RepID=A0A1I1PN79_9BACT|nr:putative membrane protein [Spirosoma endophyticum]
MASMETLQPVQEQKANRVINILSIAIPVAVAVLLGIRQKVDLGHWTTYLPHLNGLINSITSVLLLMGLYFIKQKNVLAHRITMLTAFSLGSLFLVCYVLYHLTNESTPFGGEGIIRPIYYFLLVSHIVLSIVVVWFVLRAVYFALSGQIAKHKQTVKYAFPIWLYVSITGVVVYLMIRPYYVH